LDHNCDPAYFFAQRSDSLGGAGDVETLGSPPAAAPVYQRQAARDSGGESAGRYQWTLRLCGGERDRLAGGLGACHRRLAGEGRISGSVGRRRHRASNRSLWLFRLFGSAWFFLFGRFRHRLFLSSLGRGHWIDCLV
jgi:hypothetical protein